MFYRAFIEASYSDSPKWREYGWDWFSESPDDYIRKINTHPLVKYRIKYLHSITENDFDLKLIYTKPLDEMIFYP